MISGYTSLTASPTCELHTAFPRFPQPLPRMAGTVVAGCPDLPCTPSLRSHVGSSLGLPCRGGGGCPSLARWSVAIFAQTSGTARVCVQHARHVQFGVICWETLGAGPNPSTCSRRCRCAPRFSWHTSMVVAGCSGCFASQPSRLLLHAPLCPSFSARGLVRWLPSCSALAAHCCRRLHFVWRIGALLVWIVRVLHAWCGCPLKASMGIVAPPLLVYSP